MPSVRTISADILQITIRPWTISVNCFLVRESNGWTLIDCGLPRSEKVILAAARKADAEITNITVTHNHFDHIGSLPGLLNLLPHADFWMGAREARFLAGDTRLDPGETASSRLASLLPMNVVPDHLLQDGDRLGSLEVLLTPGHTPGHLSFFDPRSRTLIVGDTLQTRGGAAIAGQFRPLFPFPALATWDSARAADSVRRLLELQPAQIAVGHGPLMQNPLSRIQRLLVS